MEEIAISEFKAKCLALREQVRKTRKLIRVTRFGKAVADVVPPAPCPQKADWLGWMADTMEITGDMVSPIIEETDWEALRLRLLLDTHIWLWSLREPRRLGRRVRHELTDRSNELWLSPVSNWDALLLNVKGRIRLLEIWRRGWQGQRTFEKLHSRMRLCWRPTS